MQKQDDTQQAAELRLAFLRHLPKRLETLRKRGLRLCTQGWDVNALSILFREIQTLAGACGRYGLLDSGEFLFALESFLAPFVEQVTIPNASQIGAFAAQLRELEPLIAQHERRYGEPAGTQAAAALTVETAQAGGFSLQVTPPPEYWYRFGPALTCERQPADRCSACIRCARAVCGAADGVSTTAGSAPGSFAAACHCCTACNSSDGRRCWRDSAACRSAQGLSPERRQSSGL